jgi:hypothetical protein
VFVHVNGDTEDGEWKDGKQVGIHLYTAKDGSTKQLKYSEGL